MVDFIGKVIQCIYQHHNAHSLSNVNYNIKYNIIYIYISIIYIRIYDSVHVLNRLSMIKLGSALLTHVAIFVHVHNCMREYFLTISQFCEITHCWVRSIVNLPTFGPNNIFSSLSWSS